MTNQTTNKSFLLHKDSLSILNQLTEEEAGKLFKAIYDYQTSNILPQDRFIAIIFEPFLNQFKRDCQKYQNVVERNKINGAKGGRPKTQDNPLGYLETQINPSEPKKADKDKDKDSDNKKDKDISNKPNKIVTVEKSELDIFCEDVVNGFQSILEDKMQRKITTNNWQKDIKLLITKDLQPRGEEQAKQDVIKCIQAIADNWKANYFPEVQSASAFREKFAKIENFLSRKKPLTRQEQLDLERKEQHDRLAKFYSNQ